MLTSIQKKNLSNLISNHKFGNVTCIKASAEIIAVGYGTGIVKLYSINYESELKTVILKEDEETANKGSVMTIEISKDQEFLITGYENGLIALWNIQNLKCIKIVKDAHKTSVICCKIVWIKKKDKIYEFLSLDISGDVNQITVKDNILRTKVEINLIFSNQGNFFKIVELSIPEKQKHDFDEISDQKVYAFVGIDYIEIFMLFPVIRKLLRFNYPENVKLNFLPDVSFGIGLSPLSEIGLKSNISIGNANMIVDLSKEHILLSISFGNWIYLYKFLMKKNEIYTFILVGHYHNDVEILKINFISNSLIYILDKSSKIKVLNSSLFEPGEIDFNLESDLKKSKKAILDENKQIQKEALFQELLIANKYRFSYENTLIHINRQIFYLSNKQLYVFLLLDWKQIISVLTGSNNWITAISFGLDLFRGNQLFQALPEFPQTEKLKITEIQIELKRILADYVTSTVKNETDSEFISDSAFKDRVELCVVICIEVAIETKLFDVLFNIIQKILNEYNFSDLFLEKLQPYILNDKISHEILLPHTINKIIEIYSKRKNYLLLSNILLHLNVKSIDITPIKNLCFEYNLINPLIYIYTNGSEENFYIPLKTMFDLFEKMISNKKYVNLEKDDFDNEITESKEYLGAKILWFIDKTIRGFKFPNNDLISGNTLKDAIVISLGFLLSENILLSFLRLYPETVFDIIYYASTKSTAYPFLNNSSFDIEPILKEKKIDLKLKDLSSKTIINYLLFFCNTRNFYNCEEVNYFLNQYLIKIAKFSYINLQKSQIIDSAKFLLSSMIYTSETISNTQKFIELNSKNIYEVISTREDFDIKDYINILNSSETSPYFEIKIYLLKKTKKYKRFVELLIGNDLSETYKKQNSFLWIQNTLNNLFIEDYSSYLELKNECLNKLAELGNIDVNKMTHFVDAHFSKDDYLDIVRKLGKNPEIQLKYIERLIEKNNSEIESSLDSITDESQLNVYKEILIIHISLLCKLNSSEVIKKIEKKENLYPIEECLKICLDNNVYDAAIYLYLIKGLNYEAVKLSLVILRSIFDKRFTLLSTCKYSDEEEVVLKMDFNSNFSKILKICESNRLSSEGREEDLWFEVLDQLYSISNTFEPIKDNSIMSPELESLSEEIEVYIRYLVEIMSSYISIQLIMEKISECYKSAKFREFKFILIKMLLSFKYHKGILSSAKVLFEESVVSKFLELKKKVKQGKKILLNVCELCNEEFEYIRHEKMIIFCCGHKFHYDCLENKEICVNCQQVEFENEPIFSGTESLLFSENLRNSNGSQSNILEINDILAEENRRKKLCEKLKYYDKKYTEIREIV